MKEKMFQEATELGCKYISDLVKLADKYGAERGLIIQAAACT